jgi:hypothetical protein
MIDLSFFTAGSKDHPLEIERHGHPLPLFDKGDWLNPKPLDEGALEEMREKRHRELRTWFIVSQSFVRKAVLRGQEVEALACYWGYTLKPLVELLRMRYCPVRWDFGMRYLDRDLPSAAHNQLRDLVFVQDVAGIEAKLEKASDWGAELLRELDLTTLRTQ